MLSATKDTAGPGEGQGVTGEVARGGPLKVASEQGCPEVRHKETCSQQRQQRLVAAVSPACSRNCKGQCGWRGGSQEGSAGEEDREAGRRQLCRALCFVQRLVGGLW